MKPTNIPANLEALWLDESIGSAAKLLAAAYGWNGIKIMELAEAMLTEANWHDEAFHLRKLRLRKVEGKPDVQP